MDELQYSKLTIDELESKIKEIVENDPDLKKKYSNLLKEKQFNSRSGMINFIKLIRSGDPQNLIEKSSNCVSVFKNDLVPKSRAKKSTKQEEEQTNVPSFINRLTVEHVNSKKYNEQTDAFRNVYASGRKMVIPIKKISQLKTAANFFLKNPNTFLNALKYANKPDYFLRELLKRKTVKEMISYMENMTQPIFTKSNYIEDIKKLEIPNYSDISQSQMNLLFLKRRDEDDNFVPLKPFSVDILPKVINKYINMLSRFDDKNQLDDFKELSQDELDDILRLSTLFEMRRYLENN